MSKYKSEIYYNKLPRHQVSVRLRLDDSEFSNGDEKQLVELGDWTKKHQVAYRSAYDIFTCYSFAHACLLMRKLENLTFGDLPDFMVEYKPHTFKVKIDQHFYPNFDRMVEHFGVPGDHWDVLPDVVNDHLDRRFNAVIGFDNPKDLTFAILLWSK